MMEEEKEKEVNTKLWDFDGNGENYIHDVRLILSEYSDSLNKQQDTIVASIKVDVNYDSNAEFTLNINDKLGLREQKVFTVVVFPNGMVRVTTHYYGNCDFVGNVKIEELDSLLEKKIKEKEMGTFLSYYMSIIKTNNIFNNR